MAFKMCLARLSQFLFRTKALVACNGRHNRLNQKRKWKITLEETIAILTNKTMSQHTSSSLVIHHLFKTWMAFSTTITLITCPSHKVFNHQCNTNNQWALLMMARLMTLK